MKLKGINIFEQHVEKVVGVLVGGAFLGVLAMQFLTEPNRVRVGTGEPLPPDRAYEPVKAAAQKLLAAVESAEPELPDAPTIDLQDRFAQRLSAGVSPVKTLTALGPAAMLEETQVQGGTADTLVAEVRVPAPELAKASMHRATIDPLEAVSVEGLAALLPAAQPFDKSSVSVEATFDGTKLREALSADPDGPQGPVRAIPLGWWRDAVDILGVELERQELGTSGDWGAGEIVPHAPGRVDLVGMAAREVRSSGDMSGLLELARQSGPDVRTPPFYAVVAGDPWTPPTESGEGLDLSSRRDRAQKSLNATLKEIERLERTQANQGKTRDRINDLRDSRDSRSGGGGGKAAGGGGGGGGPDPNARERENRTRPTSGDRPPVKTELEKKLELKIEERGRLEEELRRIDEQIAASGRPTSAPSRGPQPASPLLDDSKVRLWAHDMTARPGAVYRYRARVVINNPFFARQASLKAEQQDFAKSPVAAGDWSGWSGPVQVDADEYYFITSAAQAGALGGARATAEMYRFYYGYWRKGSTTVEPGDPLGADAKLPAGLRIFDIEKLKAGVRPASGVEIRSPDDDGGGKGRNDGRREEGIARNDVNEQAPPDDSTSAPAPEKLTFVVDAMLLDVAPLPAGDKGSRGGARAFFADKSGVVTVRYPEAETGGDLYDRLVRSAKRGENQGKTVVKPYEPPKDLPLRRSEPPQQPSNSGGGGGGGGG